MTLDHCPVVEGVCALAGSASTTQLMSQSTSTCDRRGKELI
jgi:hypothetical protein